MVSFRIRPLSTRGNRRRYSLNRGQMGPKPGLWILQKRKILRSRFQAHSVQQVNSLWITHSIQSNLRRPCLLFHMSLQLPQTPVTQSKCLQVTGNYPRRTATSHLHDTLNTVPIPIIIHRLKAKFLAHCLSNSKPLDLQIGNYSLADLTTMYKKYKH